METRVIETQLPEATDYGVILAFKRKYGSRYRILKDLDERGEVCDVAIATRFRHKQGNSPYCVWQYSDSKMACLIPKKKARIIIKTYPFFTLYLDTDEGFVCLFPADKLRELEKVLKIRMRRKLSPEQKARLLEVSKPFQKKKVRGREAESNQILNEQPKIAG